MNSNINFAESVAISLRSLRANKLRSFLTLLGIIIGVTTVITVVTIIQGLNRYVKYQLFAFGSNTFTVSRAPEIITNLKLAQEMLKRKRIEYDDYLYLKANARVSEMIEAEYGSSGTVKGMGKILGMSLDGFLTIPITTFRKYYAVNRRSLSINVMARDVESLNAAKEEVRTIMRGRRKLNFGQEDDFALEDSQTFIDFYNNLTRTLYVAMIAVAAISMLIGGIVIMNIMLVSVTERIGEIGLRKAVGARRRDILIQFLIESSSISAVGGLIGITLGFIFAKVISILTSLPAALEPWSVAVALIMSSSVGLFFGIFPANRAAKLDPVVALRSE